MFSCFNYSRSSFKKNTPSNNNAFVILNYTIKISRQKYKKYL